jgi:acetyl-CoA C-acetyltransferase
MNKKVALVGYAITPCSSDMGKSRERLIFDVVKELYDKLNITREDVDTNIIVSNDFLAGRTISNVFEDSPAGAYMRDESKVEMDGINGVIYAMLRILSGNYQTALVVAHSLCGSQVSPYLHIDYTLNPIYDRQLKLLNELSAAALQARSYLTKYGYSEELLDMVAAHDLGNAALNPFQARKISGISPQQVADSPLYYEPLRELHCYPPTDGGCALLLASEEKASELTEKPVWIMGMGQSIDTYYICERDLSTSPSAAQAAKMAYEMAGISDPRKDIDFAEISSLFAHQEPLLAEALGLLEPGEAFEKYRSGETAITGTKPINPSGGPLGAHPICATGAIRVAEAMRQLRREAGENQIKEARRAVVLGQDGMCAQQNAVLVLGL